MIYTSANLTSLHVCISARWFDKCFSLILTADGELALNFEHAWGDGVAVMSYFNEITKDLANRPSINPDSRPASIDASQHVRKLGMSLEHLQGDISGDIVKSVFRNCSLILSLICESIG